MLLSNCPVSHVLMVYRRTMGLEVMLLINDAGANAKVTVERCENVKQYCEVRVAGIVAPNISKWPKDPNLNSKGTMCVLVCWTAPGGTYQGIGDHERTAASRQDPHLGREQDGSRGRARQKLK